jgi:hypothetical protein
MSLVHRCDVCRKLVFKQDNMTVFDNEYNFEGETAKPKLKIGGQFVNLYFRFSLACGNECEVCDKCAADLIKKITKGYGK